MRINKITITNFKSLYGTREIDFNDLQGLVKLSGVLGSGKTVLGESVLWGLYGNIKDQTNPSLVSWKEKEMEIDIDITSNGRHILIKRHIKNPLEVYVDGQLLVATNKNDTQAILEKDYYDVPKLAIEKMCIVSFNLFKSLANMNPSDTKAFLDDVFGFKTFTDYNNIVVTEKKEQSIEQLKLETSIEEVTKQINYLTETKEQRQKELENNIDVDKINSEIADIKKEMDAITEKVNTKKSEIDNKIAIVEGKIDVEKDKKKVFDKQKQEIQLVINEYSLLGKQEKEWCKKFESGKCPTCGQPIAQTDIEEHRAKMKSYANKIFEKQADIKVIESDESKVDEIISNYREEIKALNTEFSTFRSEQLIEYNEKNKKVQSLNNEIVRYNSALKTIGENYDQMILEANNNLKNLNTKLSESTTEISEWTEMNELFAKTLRYNLLNQLIPQINNSIRFFVNKFEQPFNIEFDQEFKSHIYVFDMENEIKYSGLSTGQKKSLDVAIIFGILQNIISNVDFNILFLDELFTNMDANSRNNMLQVLKETNPKDMSIFVINHSEMPDDCFSHKIKVTLNSKKISNKKGNFVVKSTNYEKVF